MEILVVEDETRLGEHISRALTEAGHEPFVVHDGETALGEAAENEYDLIVLAMRERVARVSALGRRFPEKAPIKLHVSDLVLNLADRKLYRGPREIELSA